MQCCCTSRVENGHTVPSIETLAKYAQALGIPQYVYFDNHYEGFVVASVERFRRLCAAKRRYAAESPCAGGDRAYPIRYFAELKQARRLCLTLS
jgi:transcriptional regulator with XRE-family HTH domain